MIILGISAFYHDSASAIIKDGEILAASQEERFTRKKQDSSFPLNSVKWALEETGLSLCEFDAIVFYDKPLLKFERLLETYYVNAPKGFKSFLSFAPVWIKEKLFLKSLIRKQLKLIDKNLDFKKTKLLFSDHHLSHSASAFFPSPFEESAILTIDGVGEWSTATIMHGKDNKIKELKVLNFPHSVGLLYSAFTYYLGFKVNSGEYKLMGFAPYGNKDSRQTQEFINLIKQEIVKIKSDGSIFLNQDYFDYATGLKMTNNKKWEKLFGFPRRVPEGEIKQVHCNLAMAIQNVTEEIVLKMAKEAKKLTNSKNLCLAGGVALNCVANGKLLKENVFENIWIQPASGDAGGALGCALAVYHLYFEKERVVEKKDKMKGSYLGPEFSSTESEKMLKKFKPVFKKFENFEELCEKTAELLNQGNAIGWHQGKMEWGPRALGNRSILGDARNPEMQKKLNLKIKYRESFRPFAPSVLAENSSDFFELSTDSPYMLLVADVLQKRRNKLPENFPNLDLKEKLYFQRSDVPAITHLDFSARVQTVHKDTNPKYWTLINKFKELTGFGLVVNTSFNVRGEPIVCTPVDSYKCFMNTEMDYLVIENMLFKKEDQPDFQNKEKWQQKFNLD